MDYRQQFSLWSLTLIRLCDAFHTSWAICTQSISLKITPNSPLSA